MGGIYTVDSSMTVETKIAALMKIEALETPNASQVNQINQLQTLMCFNFSNLSHVMECPFFMNPIGQILEQANALYS